MMTTQSDLYVLKGKDLENFGFAYVRDLAYDAVQELWRYRQSQGWNGVKLAANLDWDTGALSRKMRGPGNWTLKTFGGLVKGLGGAIEIRVWPEEAVGQSSSNWHAYAGYEKPLDYEKTTSGNVTPITYLSVAGTSSGAN